MTLRLADFPRDVREDAAAAIRERESVLAEDLSGALTRESTLDPTVCRDCSVVLIDLLALAIEEGELDSGAIAGLCSLTPAPRARQIVHAADRAERVVLDQLSLHGALGATSDAWAVVRHAVHAAALEIVSTYAERVCGQALLRDGLTTLVSRPVFELVLEQETQRAHRHKSGIAMMLFDIDDMSKLNASHGYGAGDRVLERLGILARRFFRTHDWVTRYGGDSIAALLRETTLDRAATLATGFREMVQQRLVLVDHRTDAITTVTVSAAVVGTDLVQTEIDPADIMAEADAALVRAVMNGGKRVERVALLPTSVTVVGAATLLGTTAREVTRMIRRGMLRATRRGRHFHIDRVQLEDLRRRRESASR
jgi:diguanylate cyclase (GGDEF)-like protein/excisionase family DNA binding protein